MIRIKLCELDKHRNETTFRPLLFAKNLFSEVGIEFVTHGNADFAFVAQASIINKNITLDESIRNGLEYLNTIKEPYFIFDGQDATSLIGTYEVFKQSNAILMFKNNILSNFDLYKKKSVHGRLFWGDGEYNCQDIDDYKDRIVLSGFNWLNTFGYNINIPPINKNREYDVCALFGLSKENYEYTNRVDSYYNNPRLKIFKELSKLDKNIITSEKSGKLKKEDYYSTLLNSKICISPYGYGEVAIREIEAISTGCIIIKPTMENVKTSPDIYQDKKTYISCKPDYSDLNEKVEMVLESYDQIYNEMYNNIIVTCKQEFDMYKLVKYYYDVFRNLNGVTTE